MGIRSGLAAFAKALFSGEMMNAIPKGEKLLGPRADMEKLHGDLMGDRAKETPPQREPGMPS